MPCAKPRVRVVSRLPDDMIVSRGPARRHVARRARSSAVGAGVWRRATATHLRVLRARLAREFGAVLQLLTYGYCTPYGRKMEPARARDVFLLFLARARDLARVGRLDALPQQLAPN